MSLPLVKRRGQWFVRLQRAGTDTLYPTGCVSKKEASVVAEGIINLFDREKHSLRIARDLCKYAVMLARKEITIMDTRGVLDEIEKAARIEALETIAAAFPSPGMTCDEAWRIFSESPAVGKVKKDTADQRANHWRAFSEWCGKKRDLRSFRTPDARRFLDSLECSPQTRNNYIGDLSVVFRGAGLPPIWKELRVSGVAHAERKTVPLSDIRALLEWLDGHPDFSAGNAPASEWSAFLRVLHFTGLRPVDAASLRASEVAGSRVELMPEKTSRTRRKVSYSAGDALEKLLAPIAPAGPDGLYFPNIAAIYKAGRGNLPPAFQKVREAAGVKNPDFTLYAFRHNFVTFQLNAGVPIEDVSAAVGHSSAETTTGHYYHGRQNILLSEMPPV